MNTEQKKAYEWAKNQNYQSVAAQYAKLLVVALDDLQADYDSINDFEKSQCAILLAKMGQLKIENAQLRTVVTQTDPKFFTRKCRVCGCDWNHACPGGCSWVGDNLCSKCFQKMLGGKKDE